MGFYDTNPGVPIHLASTRDRFNKRSVRPFRGLPMFRRWKSLSQGPCIFAPREPFSGMRLRGGPLSSRNSLKPMSVRTVSACGLAQPPQRSDRPGSQTVKNFAPCEDFGSVESFGGPADPPPPAGRGPSVRLRPAGRAGVQCRGAWSDLIPARSVAAVARSAAQRDASGSLSARAGKRRRRAAAINASLVPWRRASANIRR